MLNDIEPPTHRDFVNDVYSRRPLFWIIELDDDTVVQAERNCVAAAQIPCGGHQERVEALAFVVQRAIGRVV